MVGASGDRGAFQEDRATGVPRSLSAKGTEKSSHGCFEKHVRNMSGGLSSQEGRETHQEEGVLAAMRSTNGEEEEEE